MEEDDCKDLGRDY